MFFEIPMDLKSLEKSIIAYEQEPIVKGKILFYGHSLFTRWGSPKWGYRRMDEDIRMKDGSQAIVNHGFGTSSADDLLYYYDRMVRPYKPRALVLATMGNDIGYGYSAKEVMEVVARIIQWAQADFPGIRVYCFSCFPVLKNKGIVGARVRLRKEYNQYLKDFCAITENCVYVPFDHAAFFYEKPEDIGDYDKVREDIFSPDQVHMNPYGYGLFMDYIRELLDDLL